MGLSIAFTLVPSPRFQVPNSQRSPSGNSAKSSAFLASNQTSRYEFYYDIYPLYGQYTFHVRDLHKKYGPIIRINPYELHISTPQFYEKLHSSNKPRDKWYWFNKMFALDESIFGTVDDYKHRARRGPLNPFFSRSEVEGDCSL